MNIVFWLAGVYFLAALVVWTWERIEDYQMRDLLPPPDYSTERRIHTLDRLSRNTFRNDRQS